MHQDNASKNPEIICKYCSTPKNVDELSVEVLYKRKKIPPSGAADLALYEESTKNKKWDCFKCPRCGAISTTCLVPGVLTPWWGFERREKGEVPDLVDYHNALDEWLYSLLVDQYAFRRYRFKPDEDYEIISIVFRNEGGAHVYNEEEKAAFSKKAIMAKYDKQIRKLLAREAKKNKKSQGFWFF